MKEKKNWTKWIYWFTFAVAVIVVYKTLDNFNDISAWFKTLNSILMPFFMGILISYLLYIPCRQIEGCYTWWSYMRNARETNAGWRIDYFLVSNRISSWIKEARINSEIMGSDHCPIELEI